MHAVILAGGRGTRLRPFTMAIPKPLLPLGDTPVVEIVIMQLAAAGFTKITLALNHMAPVFQALLGKGSKWGVQLEYVIEEKPLGTAGSLRLMPDLPERFLVMNGDILTTFPYGAFMRSAQRARAWAALAVHGREVHIDYGVIECDRRRQLTAYKEKPVIHYAVSMGINVVSRQALQYVPREGKFDMPELMLALQKAGRRVQCYPTRCYWQDIGRFDDYQRASEDYVSDPHRFLPAIPG